LVGARRKLSTSLPSQTRGKNGKARSHHHVSGGPRIACTTAARSDTGVLAREPFAPPPPPPLAPLGTCGIAVGSVANLVASFRTHTADNRGMHEQRSLSRLRETPCRTVRMSESG
jgi:hypothetical protein